MLTENDLVSLATLLNQEVQKVSKKIKLESNPKIVNFKIRAFLEKVKDLLSHFEGIQTTAIQSQIQQFTQFDRVQQHQAQQTIKVEQFQSLQQQPLVATFNQFDQPHNPDFEPKPVQRLRESTSKNLKQMQIDAVKPSHPFIADSDLHYPTDNHFDTKQNLVQARNVKQGTHYVSERKNIKEEASPQLFIVDSETDPKYCYRTKKQLQKFLKQISDFDLHYVDQLQRQDGSIYSGYVDKNRNPMGYGTVEWSDGARYQGEWQNGQPNGKGKLFLENGDTYEGDWKDDQASGFGCWVTSTKTYLGEWLNDVYHGQGEEKWQDGSSFQGQYAQGKKNGFGIYKWPDTTMYQGNWANNKMRGQGTYTWNDGRVYTGEWLNNNMHGYGSYRWPNGSTYEGQYLEDLRSGTGTFTWSDGRKFQGQWENGKMHGKGIYSNAKGEETQGIWFEGNRTLIINPAESQDNLN